MVFPGAGARIQYNEAGEPVGWDYPSEDPGDYCELCGGYGHQGHQCPDERDDDDE